MENETLYTAFAKAQSEISPITKDSINPHFKNKYASLSKILEDILPVLHANNLFIVQSPISDGERIGINTKIIYALNGESIESSFTVALSKNDAQGAGSALTYCKRYAIMSMLSISLDEDDDGNSASNKPNQITTTNNEINY